MRFLVDAQLPEKLCEILSKKGFEAEHVNALPDGDGSSDLVISEYADKNKFITVTKDLDFYHSHMISRKPSKLLLISTGNIKNRTLFDLIRDNLTHIKVLFGSCDFVELTNESLIGHQNEL